MCGVISMQKTLADSKGRRRLVELNVLPLVRFKKQRDISSNIVIGALWFNFVSFEIPNEMMKKCK